MKNTNENIRKKINQVSTDFVLNYGVQGWNMNDFAAKVGITKRTLYKYVENKENLIENVLLNYIKETQGNLNRLLLESTDFHQGMIQVIEVYPSMVVQLNSDLLQDIFLQYPNIEKSVIKERDKLTKELKQFISNAQKEKEKTFAGNYEWETIEDAKKYAHSFAVSSMAKSSNPFPLRYQIIDKASGKIIEKGTV